MARATARDMQNSGHVRWPKKQWRGGSKSRGGFILGARMRLERVRARLLFSFLAQREREKIRDMARCSDIVREDAVYQELDASLQRAVANAAAAPPPLALSERGEEERHDMAVHWTSDMCETEAQARSFLRQRIKHVHWARSLPWFHPSHLDVQTYSARILVETRPLGVAFRADILLMLPHVYKNA